MWLLLAPTSLDGDAMEARSWWWGMIKRRGLEDPFWGRTGTRRVRTTPRDGLGCWKKERRWRLGLWADRPKAMSLPLAFGGWRGKEFHSFMDEGKIDMWMMMTAAGGPLAFELARLDRFGGEEVRAPPSCRSLVVWRHVCLVSCAPDNHITRNRSTSGKRASPFAFRQSH